MISIRTRDEVRKAFDDLKAAVARREAVTRPDGTDGQGHPGVEAANLEGYLGRFTIPLLNEVERQEAIVTRLLDASARALERVQVGECGACQEAEMILEQVVSLDGHLVEARQ